MAAYHNLLSTQVFPSIEGQVSTGQTIVWNGTAWVAGNLTTVQKAHYTHKSNTTHASDANPVYIHQGGANATKAAASISFPSTIRITKFVIGWTGYSADPTTGSLEVGYSIDQATNVAVATYSHTELDTTAMVKSSTVNISLPTTSNITFYFTNTAGATIQRPWITIEYEF